MANYVQGIFADQNADMTANDAGVYNLLISGGQNYQKSSGIYIGNNTVSKPGINIAFTSSNDMSVYHNASAGNTMNFRFGSNSSFNNMLILTNDMRTQTRGLNAYAGHFHGRVQATQYFINANGEDNMRSNGLETGLYMNSNTAGNFFITNVSQTVIDNNGTLFKFMATNATGDLHANETQQWIDSDSNDAGLNRWRKDTKMEIFYNGIVQLPRYQKTTDAFDIDTTAFAGFDSKGNLVRDFNTNKRIREIEEDVVQMNLDFMDGLTQKVNNIIGRVNGLNFFSDTILEYRLPPVPTGVTITQTTVFTGGAEDKFTVAIEQAASANESGSGASKPADRTVASWWDASAHGHITYTVEVSYVVSPTQKYLLTHTGIESTSMILTDTNYEPAGVHTNRNTEITMKYTNAYSGTAGTAPSEAVRWWDVAQTVTVVNTTGLSDADLAKKQFTVKVYAVARPPINGSRQHVASLHTPSQFDANTSYDPKSSYTSDALYPDNKGAFSAAAIKDNKSLKSVVRRVNPTVDGGLKALKRK
jgi:hypothetical protein